MSSALEKLKNRSSAVVSFERILEIPVSKIKFDPNQPRTAYNFGGVIDDDHAAYIAELAENIKANGLIQPIAVQDSGDGTYLVVTGECRTRAHLLLGLPTIRAYVQSEVTAANQRLIVQLSENVVRQDLTDAELAKAIQRLIAGENGDKPMSQVEVAKALSKSEGWVSRFVKFGDEELQRRWVHTGIATTVENVYRLSTLPKSMQVDIISRVDSPEDAPFFLPKPLTREFIDQCAKEAKNAKEIKSKKDVFERDKNTAASPTHNGVQAVQDDGGKPDSSSAAKSNVSNLNNDTPTNSNIGVVRSTEREIREYSTDSVDVGAALANEVINNPRSDIQHLPTTTGVSSTLSTDKPKYQLPKMNVNEFLGTTAGDLGNYESGGRESVAPPINWILTVDNITALLESLKSDDQTLSDMGNIKCHVQLPAAMAQSLANKFAGIIVDWKDVPATLSNSVSMLR